MNLIYKSLLFVVFCLLSVAGFSQEMVFDLTSNPRLSNGAWEEAERRYQSNSRAAGDTLELPFFDDFSEPFSRLNNPFDLYPSLDRWIGRTVYVNNHMAINPPSQGVATLEGLDENGQAYGFGFTLPVVSDSLTSKPLNLESANDVLLSFYYQAQGLGNAPEDDDKLVLEFKDTAETWNRVWETEGYILEDFIFNQVLLPVVDDEYLFSGFQFRFINYSSRSGNVDHWHLDYISLEENNTEADTLYPFDVALLGHSSFVNDSNQIQSETSSLLLDYQSMPWTHYKSLDEPSDVMDSLHYFLGHNNADSTLRVSYNFNVLQSDGSNEFSSTISTGDIDSLVVCGNQFNTCNLNPAGNFLFSTEDFVYPTSTDVELTADSAFFVIQKVLGVEDDNALNDTSVSVQKFYNYYAYDDGTAESAYGLGVLEVPSFVAVRYDIKKEDDLQALQIYLNPVGEDVTQVPVKLMVWDGPTEPETVLYESPEFINLSYSEGANYFYHYPLETPLTVGETILWIGWRQEPFEDIKFSVGRDLRTDNSDKVFYNLGTTWTQSSIPGSLMIRPVFGQAYDWVSGVDESLVESLSVYPNPTTGVLQIKESVSGQFKNANVSMFDITGREVFSQNGYANSLDVSNLKRGTYLLQLVTEAGQKLTERVVIR